MKNDNENEKNPPKILLNKKMLYLCARKSEFLRK